MTDTTREAAEAQVQVLRGLSPVARLELAVDMSTMARALLRARLRVTHPEWSDPEVDRELLRHTLPHGVLPPPRPMTAADLFRRVVTLLDEVGIPYMLTGSFASSYHGIPRATQDIDLVIAPTADQLRHLVGRLPAAEYYVDEATALEALAHESQFNVIDLATGWKIDFICRRNRPFSRTEFERRTRAEVQGLPLFIATAEDVLLAKLEWAKHGGSQRQIEDVAGLLRVRGPDLDLEYLTGWVEALGLSAEWSAAQQAAGHGAEPEGAS